MGRGCTPGGVSPERARKSPSQRLNLSRIGPIFRPPNQSRPHGIHAHIFPLLAITLAAPQNVVEKTGLPGSAGKNPAARARAAYKTKIGCRPGLYPWRISNPAARTRAAYKIQTRCRPGLHLRRAVLGDRDGGPGAIPPYCGQMALERPDPTRQCLRAFHGNEEMDVIRHQDVVPDPCGDSLRRATAKIQESAMDFRTIQPLFPLRRAKSHEEKRPPPRRPNGFQPPQATGIALFVL